MIVVPWALAHKFQYEVTATYPNMLAARLPYATVVSRGTGDEQCGDR